MSLNEKVFQMALEAASKRASTIAEQTIREAVEFYVDAIEGEPANDQPKPAPVSPPSSDDIFKVFDAMRYRVPNDANLVNLLAQKTLSIDIHYESAFFDDKQSQGSGAYAQPDTHRITESAADGEDLLCVDIERWWGFSDNDLGAEGAKAYEIFADEMTGWLEPDREWGFYSTLPIRSLWKALRDPEGWQAINDRLLPVGSLVDVTFPSLYNLVDDDGMWEEYALSNIAEAKRIANGKPCYPFIWPTYHNNAKEKRGTFVGEDQWFRQLELLKKHADGCVIWTRSDTKNVTIDLDWGWWQATESFLRMQP